MKITLHKKIAAYFGYEFTKIRRKAHQDFGTHLLTLFENLEINCVLDVGANMGQYVEQLRKSGYEGKIISFEPIEECYEHLKKSGDDSWKIVNYALGNTEGEANINVTNKNVFSSILSPNEYAAHRFNQSAQVNHPEKIKIKRLDDVLEDILPDYKTRNIFLKLDTQGYDLEVLKGASRSIQYIKAFQSEVSCKAIYSGMPSHIESLDFFDSLGFEITGIFPLAHDKQDMSLLEFDCVLKKKSV